MLGAQIRDGLKTLRVTIIDGEGKVLFDNAADPDALENHLDRPEVAAAMQSGAGESERFSDTLGETTYYYAIRLGEENILRLALTTDNLTGRLYTFIPALLLCLAFSACLAFFVARKLTKRITAPINDMNLDAPELGDYDELLPFVQRIEMQKRELSAQLGEIENRTATITAITENMKEGLLLLDEWGRLLLANESVMAILENRDVVGKKLNEICRDMCFLEQANACPR